MHIYQRISTLRALHSVFVIYIIILLTYFGMYNVKDDTCSLFYENTVQNDITLTSDFSLR